MIESLTVENFRCFERVEIPDVKRVNAVVGKDARGKHALLESVFIGGGGHPEISLRLRAWRLLGDVQIKADKAIFESVWRNLFFAFDQDRVITISLKGTPQNTRTLRVFYEQNTQ